MRVIFMGTPDFAVPSLQKLIDRGDDILAVFTQPDKPKGRGHKMQFPPVKELALQHDIPVHQPDTLKNEEAVNVIKELAPDVIVVTAYGKLLPESVLNIPTMGCINVHGSLLPKYRGAAPIQWAVIRGEMVTGVTTMYMGKGMDTGDMLLKAETEIGPDETAGELFERLKDIGADLLGETLNKLEKGELQRIPQNEAEATLAPMLKKDMSDVDWSKSAEEINCLIRGLNPWPCAHAMLDGKRIKLLASKVVDKSGEAGYVVSDEDGLTVFCGENALIITQLQTENGKRMGGKEYLLGHPLKEGSKFEPVE